VEPSGSGIALPECERRFRAAFADPAIGLAIFDGDGRLTYANQSLCRMSGHEAPELYGMKFTEMLHPEDRADERRLLGARKLAEDAISQLAAIVDCSPDAIVATDTSGAITAWNEGARQLVGYTVSEALALPIAALFSSADPARKLLSLIHLGQSSSLGEMVLLRGNGSHVPVLLSVSPILKIRRPIDRFGYHRPRHQRSQEDRKRNGGPGPS